MTKYLPGTTQEFIMIVKSLNSRANLIQRASSLLFTIGQLHGMHTHDLVEAAVRHVSNKINVHAKVSRAEMPVISSAISMAYN